MSTELVAEFNVDTPGITTNAGALSGGNLQKLILARELTTDPKLIIAAHPTQGLDVGATEAVRNRLLEQQAAGVAVLLISEDLDELFSLADRIAVLNGGRVMGVVEIGATTRAADRFDDGRQADGLTQIRDAHGDSAEGRLGCSPAGRERFTRWHRST